MARTGDGQRRPSDYYPTPEWAIDVLLREIDIGPGVLEPCAGDGAIVRAIRRVRPMAYIIAVEIRAEEQDNLVAAGADEVHVADFLQWSWSPDARYANTIITNPPFSHARQIIECCLKWAERGTDVWMLLRLAFLESRERLSFWRKYRPNRLCVLAERPSFTGSGTDAAAYAWFGWIAGAADQRIEVLSRGD